MIDQIRSGKLSYLCPPPTRVVSMVAEHRYLCAVRARETSFYLSILYLSSIIQSIHEQPNWHVHADWRDDCPRWVHSDSDWSSPGLVSSLPFACHRSTLTALFVVVVLLLYVSYWVLGKQTHVHQLYNASKKWQLANSTLTGHSVYWCVCVSVCLCLSACLTVSQIVCPSAV